MNILFYTELHPIRNELTHHNSVAIRWMNIADRIKVESTKSSKKFNYKILCHHYHYKQALTSLRDAGEYLLPVLPTEFMTIKSNQKYWDEDAIETWKDMLLGKEHDALKIYKEILTRTKKIYDYDVVVFWGDNNYLASWLREQGVKVIFMELACMRNPFPPSVYVDIFGVNGQASSSSITMDYIRQKDELLIDPEVLLDLYNTTPLSKQNPFDSFFSVIGTESWKTKIRGSRKAILVPLQIADDTNILTSSPFSSAFDFLQKVIEDFKGHDVDIYVKPHPGALTRAGVVYNDHKACKKLIDEKENIFWLDDEISRGDYLQFLKSFDAVVTINSSLGYEAMMVGTPTVALGQAMYRPQGICYNNKNYVDIILNGPEKIIAEGLQIARFIFCTKLLPVERGIELKNSFEAQIEIAINSTGNIEDYYDAIFASEKYPFWSCASCLEEIC